MVDSGFASACIMGCQQPPATEEPAMTATTSHVATDPATGQQHEFTTLDDLARQFGGNRWRTAGWAGTPPDWQWVIQLYDFPNPAATDACKIVKILRVHHSVWASETS